MNDISKTPTFNLKVVIQETGLKADTLRAWERRYGLPDPQRTSGGHRLYSQYDIEMIKWLMERQKEGLRIHHAVEMWRNFEQAGQDPFQEMPVQVMPASPGVGIDLGGKVLEEIKQDWVNACITFNEARAENILAQAFARYPMEAVCLEVLRQGLSDIGTMWYEGSSSVQQEHFASALAIRRLNALLAAAPPPSRRAKLLAACPPGEDHIFPLLMITLFLRQRGYDVVYLGADVPLSKFDLTVRSAKPNLVISTAQQLHTAANLFEVAEYMKQMGVPIAYGGLVFNVLPQLRNHISGYFLGEKLEGVVAAVENILMHRPEIPVIDQVSVQYSEAVAEFRDNQPSIAAATWDKLRSNGIQEKHLEIANQFLAQDIEAGLKFGDLDLLGYEFDWLSDLLQSHEIPVEILPEYLSTYSQAVKDNLDERGQPIVDWLNKIVSRGQK